MALPRSLNWSVSLQYQTAGCELPSIFSTESRPFDAPHLTSAKLTKVVQIIEAACTQLMYTVANPGHTITNVHLLTYTLGLFINRLNYRKHMVYANHVNTLISTLKEVLVQGASHIPGGHQCKNCRFTFRKTQWTSHWWIGSAVRPGLWETQLHFVNACYQALLSRRLENTAYTIITVNLNLGSETQCLPNVSPNNRLSMQLVSITAVSGLAGNMYIIIQILSTWLIFVFIGLEKCLRVQSCLATLC